VALTVAFPYWSSSWSDPVRTLPLEADSPVEEQVIEPTPPAHDNRGIVFGAMPVIPMPAIVGEAFTVILRSRSGCRWSMLRSGQRFRRQTA
jgi:hypothetical protein